jgi:hypothetical protein
MMQFLFFLKNCKKEMKSSKIKKNNLQNNFYYFFVTTSKFDFILFLDWFWVFDLSTNPAPLT